MNAMSKTSKSMVALAFMSALVLSGCGERDAAEGGATTSGSTGTTGTTGAGGTSGSSGASGSGGMPGSTSSGSSGSSGTGSGATK